MSQIIDGGALASCWLKKRHFWILHTFENWQDGNFHAAMRIVYMYTCFSLFYISSTTVLKHGIVYFYSKVH